MLRETPDEKIDIAKIYLAEGSVVSLDRARIVDEIRRAQQAPASSISGYFTDALTLGKDLTEHNCDSLARDADQEAAGGDQKSVSDDEDSGVVGQRPPREKCSPVTWVAPALVTPVPTRTIAIPAPPPCPPGKGGDDEEGGMEPCTPAPKVKAPDPKPEPPKVVDRDGDGIPDKDDKCPSVSGDAANKGCPVDKDSDGDGLLDSKDDCKGEPGPPQLVGCPDKDGDGIADKLDACVGVRGSIKTGARAGCNPIVVDPKCVPPPPPRSVPAGYQCGDGKSKVGIGCLCPAGQRDTRNDEGTAVCWVKPAGC